MMWNGSTRSASPPRTRGYGNRHVVETRYILTRNGPMGSPSQSNAAAMFFAKAHQKLQQQQQLQRQQRARDSSSEERDTFPTCFKTVVQRFPPMIPSLLLKKLDSNNNNNDESESVSPAGRIKILLRVAPICQKDDNSGFFHLDKRKKQVTLYDPSSMLRNQNNSGVISAPKMFAFDGLFSAEDSQEDVSNAALTDAIQSVINGRDGTVFCFGHANLGKSRTMIGSDQYPKDLGIIPTAIAWLYRAIKDRKSKSGARFSVRVSALEIQSNPEEIRDLLSSYANAADGTSPGVYLANDTSHLANISELRAASPEKAAFYLDASLAARSNKEKSHFFFTIHLYQYTMDNNNYSCGNGGRSRLHLIDFGSCDRIRSHPHKGITLSGLGNVILGIFNGQRHLPHRDSKVTQVLKECLGSLMCNACIIAHVSSEPSHYSETLHTVSVSSRLHRMRRKRMKISSSSKIKSRSGSSGSRSSSDMTTTSGTSTNASSSEFSCDTVVYRGGGCSDSSGTDNEHPPSSILYGVRSLRHHHSAPNSLKGSLDEIPRPRRRTSGSKILTNGAISPRHNLSPTPSSVRSQHRSSHSSLILPAIPESTGKMPLNGRVPGRRQPSPLVNNNNNSSFEEVSKSKKYGYMDDHKANMIHSWVENQTSSTEPVFKVLTQFKTCEEDEEEEQVKKQQSKPTMMTVANERHHRVQIHPQPLSKKLNSRCTPPPPPPPRRTPPRVIENNSAKLSEIYKKCEELVETFEEDEEDDIPPLPPPPPMEPMTVLGMEQHPLRILSEENLTVVSSFGGSLNDIRRTGEVNDEEEDLESSKLITEFNKINENLTGLNQPDFFLQRFEDMTQVPSFVENNNNINQGNDIAFSDPRFINGRNNESLSTFSSNANLNRKLNSLENLLIQRSERGLSPQRQFKLLSKSLRHPDGSSNPELNNEIFATDIYNNNNGHKNGGLPDRSPGNGQSDPEEPIKLLHEEYQEDEEPRAFKKESSRFSFRLFRFFGSSRKNGKGDKTPRSKSCDRGSNKNFLDNNKMKDLISSSKKCTINLKKSSPMSQGEDTTSVAPSVLSLDTEWEYQNQQQQQNYVPYTGVPSYVNTKILSASSKTQTGDRKSSGYDSIGGESSSMDSNEEHPGGSATSSFKREIQYSTPNDGQPNLIEYDEVDILRMEARNNK